MEITAIIPVYNESDMIDDCIKSVLFCDEVLLVDSFSTDDTCIKAASYGERVKILKHEYVYSARQKNWAIPQAKNEWILLVDGDERISDKLKEEILSLMNNNPSHDAYWIYRKNHFLHREIRHGGWETDRVIRLFKRDMCRYQDREVHAEVEGYKSIGFMKNSLLHFTFRSFRQYFPKVEKYTTWAAQTLLRNKKKTRVYHILLFPVFHFIKVYFLRLGFIDGVCGLMIAWLDATSTFLKYAKAWEMQHNAA